LRRHELMEILYPQPQSSLSPKKENKDNDDWKKHDYPQQGQCYNVRI
jgi:hypothetical protein